MFNNMKIGYFLFTYLLAVDAISVLNSSNIFARNLYQELPNKGENIIFSPFSVHSVLSLVYGGTIGVNADNCQQALNLPDIYTTVAEYQNILRELNEKENVSISIANKIYFDARFKLKDAFRSIARDYFFSDVERIKFRKGKKAAEKINNWAKQHTNNTIDELVQPNDFDRDTVQVLLNAIHFKGQWEEKFNATLTEKGKFYISETETVDCDMMYQKSIHLYRKNSKLKAQLLKLDYLNGDFSFVIVLPYSRTGLGDLERKLATADIGSLISESSFKESKIALSLPKLKLESAWELKDPLMKIGLNEIFQPSMNWNIITSDQSLHVDTVRQKAFIEVDEEGSVATAATVVKVQRRKRERTVTFKVDRPFLFFLTGKVTGRDGLKTDVVLFMGRVTTTEQREVSHSSSVFT